MQPKELTQRFQKSYDLQTKIENIACSDEIAKETLIYYLQEKYDEMGDEFSQIVDDFLKKLDHFDKKYTVTLSELSEMN